VVRRALDEGYDVRCLVRPRLTPADFLRDWGATTVQVRAHVMRALFLALSCWRAFVLCCVPAFRHAGMGRAHSGLAARRRRRPLTLTHTTAACSPLAAAPQRTTHNATRAT
jgi:hypothetical protein